MAIARPSSSLRVIDCANQRLEIGRRLNGSFDAMHSWDWQPGVLDKTLVAGDSIANLGNQPLPWRSGRRPPHTPRPASSCVFRSSHKWGRICTCVCAVPVFVLVSTVVFAQDKTVDQGVYTSAQAARGAKLFESNCMMCHREPGGTAPVLAGERFTKTFSDATLQTVFTTIKTTMPRNAPGSLSDAGVRRPRLALAEDQQLCRRDERARRRGPARDQDSGSTGSLDFALVQVVGCLAQNGRAWTLSRATEPVRTREPEAPKDDAAAQLDGAPLGDRTLPPAAGLRRASRMENQKVVAKGFLTKAGSEDRVNITSMRTLTSSCAN